MELPYRHGYDVRDAALPREWRMEWPKLETVEEFDRRIKLKQGQAKEELTDPSDEPMKSLHVDGTESDPT